MNKIIIDKHISILVHQLEERKVKLTAKLLYNKMVINKKKYITSAKKFIIEKRFQLMLKELEEIKKSK